MWKVFLAGWVILANTTQASPHGAKVLTSFDGRETGFDWYAVNDDVMGGRSRGGFEISQGRLRFRGEINTDGGGFASIRTEPRPLDVAMHGGVGIRVRGDGRTYQFRLMTRRSDIFHVAEFTTRPREWQDIELPFSGFVPSRRGRRLEGPPLNVAEVVGMGFLIAGGQEGEFTLEIDSITALAR